jgi:hypothetical protein
MHDNCGRLLFTRQTTLLKADEKLGIDLSGYTEGLYYVHIRNLEAIETEKIIIQ